MKLLAGSIGTEILLSGKQPAIIYDGDHISYTELGATASDLAAKWKHPRGEPIGAAMSNPRKMLVALIALDALTPYTKASRLPGSHTCLGKHEFCVVKVVL